MFYLLFLKVTTEELMNFMFFWVFYVGYILFLSPKAIFNQIDLTLWRWSFICSAGLIAAFICLDKPRCAMYNKLNYLIISVLIVIAFTQN